MDEGTRERYLRSVLIVPALVLAGIVFLVLAPRGRQLVAVTGTQMSDATAPSGR
jgi:hypothetical protein